MSEEELKELLHVKTSGKVEGRVNLFSWTADRKVEPVKQYLSDLLEQGKAKLSPLNVVV